MRTLPYLPFLTLVFLGACTRVTHGQYHRGYLIALMVAVVLASWQLLKDRARRPQIQALLALCLFQGVWLARDPGLFAPTVEWAELAVHWFTLAHLACLVGTLWFFHQQQLEQAARPLIIGGVMMLLARLAVLLAAPTPFIDVFIVGTEGADRFLQGQDPFVSEYSDIYEGTYQYRPGYIYWPTVLYIQTAARLLFGDIRTAFILFELAAVLLILHLTRSRGPLESRLWATAWWTFPVAPTVLENAWVDTFLLTFVVGLLWSHRRGSAVGAGVNLGLMAACKQYALVIPPLYWLLLGRLRGWREGLKALLWTGITWLAMMVPFAVSGGWGFYDATFRSVLILPMRPDALTLQSFLLKELGWRLPQGLVLLLYLGAFFGLLSWLYRQPDLNRFRSSLFVIFSVIFIVGKQAFLNYYYLLAFLLLLAVGEIGEESEQV